MKTDTPTPRTQQIVDEFCGQPPSCLEVVKLTKLAADLERELHEQCVLNGKGSEREAALLGKVARLEKGLAASEQARRELVEALEPFGRDIPDEAKMTDFIEVTVRVSDLDTANLVVAKHTQHKGNK